MQPVVDWLRHLWGRRGDQVRLAYRRVFAGESGQYVMADLSALCGEAATSFSPGDPHQTAFQEGKRSVLLHIRSVLGLKPGELLPFLPSQEEPSDD